MKTYSIFLKTTALVLVFFIKNIYSQAAFTSVSNKGCSPITVGFVDKSVNAVRWEWDFGNGNKSLLQNPSAVYITPGKYTVTLTTWDAAGNSTKETKTDFVWVYKNPIAAFIASKTEICEGEKITFTSNSTEGDAAIDKFSWDFGNGIIKDGGSTMDYTYLTSGVFSASLIIVDKNGCSHKVKINNYIKVNPAPKPDFSLSFEYDCVGPATVKVTYLGTKPISKILWDLGNGNTSTDENPTTTYTNDGSYDIKLYVEDDKGCKKEIIRKGAFKIAPLAVDFTATPTKLCGSGKVDFINKSTFASNIASNWDFGNGNTSSIRSPTETYSKTGKYTVTLKAKVIGNSKCDKEITKPLYIQVFPIPNGKIKLTTDVVCILPADIKLEYEKDSVNVKSVNWFVKDLGDKDKETFLGTGNIINSNIKGVGPFKIFANVVSNNDCIKTIESDVEIKLSETEPVIDRFGGNCLPILNKFTNASTPFSNLKSWEWFIDGVSQGTDLSTSKFSTKVENYTVVLKIIDKYGCEKVDSLIVNIGDKTNPDFSVEPLIFCNNELVIFKNLTIKDTNHVDKFIWYPNGDTSNEKDRIERLTKIRPKDKQRYLNLDLKYKYDRDSGFVNVVLISVNNGCETYIKKLKVLFIKPPKAKIEIQGNPCNGDSLLLESQSIGEHRLKWHINGGFIKQTSPKIKLSSKSNYKIILFAFNDSTKCEDTDTIIYIPKIPIIEINDNSKKCFPALIDLNVNASNATFHSWFLNGKSMNNNTKEFEYKPDTAGIYTIKLYYELGLCIGEIIKKVPIGDSRNEGSIKVLENCSTLRVEATDSFFGKTTNTHFWSVGNFKVPVTATTMLLNLDSFDNGNNISIKLINVDKYNKCGNEKVFTFKSDKPHFNFKYGWSKLSCSNLEFQGGITLTNLSSPGPVKYNWLISNGAKSTAATFKYQFKDSGWYTVYVSITDAKGCVAKQYVKVYSPFSSVKAAFTSKRKGSVCSPMRIDFEDLSTSTGGYITKWLWKFGDGDESTLKNPSHNYLKLGVYDITLTVTDNAGCVSTIFYPEYLSLKGISGSYTIKNLTGCMPLTTIFEAKSSVDSVTYNWDFGDGTVYAGPLANVEHIYKKPGRFIPRLTIKEKPGCFLGLLEKDTINVYPLAVAKVFENGLCYNNAVDFKSIEISSDPILYRHWIFPDSINKTNTQNIKHKFTNNENTWAKYIVSTVNNCLDSVEIDLNLIYPKISLFSNNDTLCLGSSFTATSSVDTDYPIVSSQWFVNSVPHSSNSNLLLNPTKPGLYTIAYKVVDDQGCWDSTVITKPINVGDTIEPPLTNIHFVSVTSDVSNEIVFQKSPTKDFSSYQIYQADPLGNYRMVKQVKGFTDTMVEITGLNALQNSYCYKVQLANYCKFTQKISVLKEHCTVESKAKGGLNIAVVNWTPYVGWPVKQYHVLRLNKTTNNFDSIGAVLGTTLTFTDTSVLCKQEHNYQVKAIKNDTHFVRSLSDTCKAKPEYKNTVNPPVFTRATVPNNDFVNIEWEEIYPNKNAIVKYDIFKQNGTKPLTYLLQKNSFDNWSVDDTKTDVQNTEYNYYMYSIDACNDTSKLTEVAQNIVLNLDVDDNYRPYLYWNEYKIWPEGVFEYVVEKRPLGGTFEEIGRTKLLTMSDNISKLNCEKGFEYRVYAIRNTTRDVRSYSNFRLPAVEPKVYTPNVFSPNGNNLNEKFKPVCVFVEYYTMRIFNRWGEKLYENSECENSWDGKYKNEEVPAGVYVYTLKVKGINGKFYDFYGTITTLR